MSNRATTITWNQEQILAEKKAIAIIKSCTTTQHFDIARTYLELFHNRYNDIAAYTRLWMLWKRAIIS